MASKESQEKPEAGFLCVLRAAALIALLVGAVGSVGLMLHAGRRKDSPRLLLALFAIWVLSPLCGPRTSQHRFEGLVGHYPSDAL